MLTCPYCSKSYKTINALNSHKGYCKSNPNAVEHPATRRVGKNNPMYGKKGCNQYTENKSQMSQETKEKISKSNSGSKWSEERKNKHSKVMSRVVKNNPESYRHGNKGGRTKIYEYKGFKLRGTWELKVAMYLDSIDIKWTNHVNSFSYIYENKERQYYPDFYLPDHDIYIEVKGYETERDVAKWSSIDNLLVIKKKEINKIQRGTYNIFP